MKTKIVFDLEATCEDKSINPNFDNETIEIGAVKIVGGKVVDEFQSFVKPVRSNELTDFCKELTHIKQADIDNAPSFSEALESFKSWAGDAEFLSWGFYDRKQLEKDSMHSNLPVEWLINHRSVKHEHQKIKKLDRPVGVPKALKMEGLKFVGTHHRGIDDARNIAKVYISVFND
ncbi:exonuclease domain-containing protein [Bacillus cereus group sp. Bce040]|uniref:exonuclease domain-containing protein n=1 Tax=Bacillus cereus group sp. Bce040 TaxID=3445229 RepID=UPI003F254628